jgi:hypothetical protein
MMDEGQPAVVSNHTMAAILEDMAERVRRGLCLSGKIEFHLADDFNGAGPEEFSVLGAYRIGRKEETQLEGLQGHARIINADMDCSEWIFLASSQSSRIA